MIRKGSRKINKLYKGDELVSRVYKGSDLIYKDVEAIYGFKFTIDTTLKENGTHDANDAKATHILLSNNQNNSARVGVSNPVVVFWGDGTQNRLDEVAQRVSHTYSTPGEYQIMILPEITGDQEPAPGWLSGIKLAADGSSSYGYTSAYKVISYDTKLPKNSYIVELGDATPTDYTATRNLRELFFYKATNLVSCPDGFFDNVVFSKNPASTAFSCSYMFANTFSSCGLYTSFPIRFDFLKKLIGKIDTTGVTNFSYMFSYTFSYTNFNSSITFTKDLTVPSDLFHGIDTSSGTNFRNMFSGLLQFDALYGTFAPAARNIPENLFSTLDVSNGENFSNMFSAAFYGFYKNATSSITVPRVFPTTKTSNGTNFSNMFTGTFEYWSTTTNNLTFTIPSDLFSFVDMTNATNIQGVFSDTFSRGSGFRDFIIQSGLFSTLSTSNVTDFSYMFSSTFFSCTPKSNFSIPADLFYLIDTSSGTKFTNMFYGTFNGVFSYSNSDITLPLLFARLDTHNGIDFSNMFYNTFNGGRKMVVPTGFFPFDTSNGINFADIFHGTFVVFTGTWANCTKYDDPQIYASLDTSNGTNFSGMFSSAELTDAIDLSNLDTSNGVNFSNMFNGAYGNILSSIPANIFSWLDTHNGENFSGMFSSAFQNSQFPVGELVIPATLFSSLDTSNGTNFSGMFQNTFCSYGSIKNYTGEIPAGLFDFLDTSNGTNFSSMFNSTFMATFMPELGGRNLPANLFAHVDTTNATNMSSMFQNTFRAYYPVKYPSGLFGGITIPSGANCSAIFNCTFCASPNSSATPSTITTWNTVLEDVFYGMSDFSWATSQNANSVLGSMFSQYSYVIVDVTSGSASTILQHFNFIPSTRTSMFRLRTNLLDYSTINDNWK